MLVYGKIELWLGDGTCIVDLTPDIVAKVIVDAGFQASGSLSDTFVESFGRFQHSS